MAEPSPALNTQIESGNFDEKAERPADPAPSKVKAEDDDDEDEDIDALIEDLESQDGHGADDEEDEERDQHGGRLIPEELLQTVSQPPLPSSAAAGIVLTISRTLALVLLRLRSSPAARSTVSTR